MHFELEKPPGPASLALQALRPRRPPATDADAPELTLDARRVAVDQDRLAAWRAFCGFRVGRGVPLPYLFVLGFHAQAALVVSRAFPLRPLGMVHTRCRLESHRATHAGDELRLELRLTGWTRVRQGREVEIDIRYLRRGEEVARGVQTSLARGGGTGEPRRDPPRTGPPEDDFPGHDTWHLEADTGRRYARVSGDHNPIHLWPWSARLFGQRRPIAHGMYLVSRAVSTLDPSGDAEGRVLEARFKTPAELPGEVRCYHRIGEDDGDFELWRGDGSRPHVVGRLGSMASES